MGTFYNNDINITSGRVVQVQEPIDDRLIFANVDDVTDAIVNDTFVRWYKFMAIYIREIHEFAIWLPTDEVDPQMQPLVVPGTFAQYIDPAFIGTIYENKDYSFYRIMSVPAPHSHVESDISNLDKYTKQEVDTALANKQNRLPAYGGTLQVVLHFDPVQGTYYWAQVDTVPDAIGTNLQARTGGLWNSIYQPNVSPIQSFTGNGYMPLPDRLILPGGLHNLVDPSSLPPNYNVLIIHDGTSSDAVRLLGYPIDGVNYSIAATFNVPIYQSVWLGVINGQWRTLNRIT